MRFKCASKFRFFNNHYWIVLPDWDLSALSWKFSWRSICFIKNLCWIKHWWPILGCLEWLWIIVIQFQKTGLKFRIMINKIELIRIIGSTSFPENWMHKLCHLGCEFRFLFLPFCWGSFLSFLFLML